ncbi:MAG: hypothetical protein V4692_09210, partial [Bdellovibrionota bacterium]
MRFFLIFILAFFSHQSMAELAPAKCEVSPFESVVGLPMLDIQDRLCDASECGLVSVADLSAYDSCSVVDGSKAISESAGLSGLMNDVAEGMVFQDLARNSHQQAVCRNEFLLDYEDKESNRNRLNDAASAAFDKIKDELSMLIAYGSDVETKLHDEETRRLAGRIAWGEGEHEKRKQEVESIKAVIAQKILAVPMGYDSDVSKALLGMGATGKFDASIFRAALARARFKYHEADKFYSSKFMPLKGEKKQGTYCLWVDWRNQTARSGQLRKYIESYPATTADEKSFKTKMTCRLTRTYECGQKKLKDTATMVAFASTLIPPVRVIKGVGAIASAARTALTSTAILRGAAALDAAFSSQLLYDECFGSKMASSDRKTCDPEKEFERTIEGPKVSSCVLGIGTSAISILQSAKAFKDGVRALDVVGGVKAQDVDDAVVAAGRVVDLSPRDAREAVGLVGATARNQRDRARMAVSALGRNLNKAEKNAVEAAHKVGEDRVGAGYENYTRAELKEKRRILKAANFSDAEINKLMRLGIAGRLPYRTFGRGERVYVPRSDGQITEGRVIQTDGYNVLVEVTAANGQKGIKPVGASTLSDVTGLMRSKKFEVEDKVWITVNGTSRQARISAIDKNDGEVLVEYPTPEGPRFVYSNPEDLKKVVIKPEPVRPGANRPFGSAPSYEANQSVYIDRGDGTVAFGVVKEIREDGGIVVDYIAKDGTRSRGIMSSEKLDEMQKTAARRGHGATNGANVSEQRFAREIREASVVADKAAS